jgi:CheY-like chemotaxis protein
VQGHGRDPAPSTSSSGLLPVDPHQDLAGAIHDVSNALTVLLGWVAEARSGRASPEEIHRALAIVDHQARMARDVARRAIGAQVILDEHEESMDTIVDSAVEALTVEAVRAEISLAVPTRSPGTRLPLASDASQVLTNLLLNALAWGPRGSRVTVECVVDGALTTLLVRDEGPGLSLEEGERVFSGASRRQGGAGVGLRHARAVARSAGGDVDIVREPGVTGTCFRMTWPRAQPPAPPLSVPRPAVLAGTRILVVEDDGDVATLLESALGARGAQVVVARNAEELGLRAREDYDAALVDLSPIAHDVQGAVAQLAEGSPEAVLVFISGSATAGADLGDLQRYKWVRKPFEVNEIVSAILEGRPAVVAARGAGNASDG